MAGAAPPDPDDQVHALCEVLNAYGVTYLVFGSMAGRLQGADIQTLDVDVVPENSPGNLQRLADALNTLRPRWRPGDVSAGIKIDGRLEARHFRGDSMAVGLVTRLGYLDVLLRPAGFEKGYEALLPHSVTMVIDDVEIRVGSLGDLVASKRLVRRPKDLVHLKELEPLLAKREALLPDVEIKPPSRDLGAEPDLGP